MKTYNILFLCTHNSARSILGEALASTHHSGLFHGFSAGSTPGDGIHPIARQLTQELGYDQNKLRSKSWHEYASKDAPKMDFIITVCDQAAQETCPYWPGQPVTAHWSFPDPSKVQGDEAHKHKAFVDTLNGLRNRIESLAQMPLEKLDSMSLRKIHLKA